MIPNFSLKDTILFLLCNFFRPVTSGYWFTTAWLILILICPLINNFTNQLTKKGFILFLFTVWFFYYATGFVISDSYFSVVRAVFFYVLGAFIRLHCSPGISKTTFTGYVVLCIFLWILMSCLFYNYYYIPSDLSSTKTYLEKIITSGFKSVNNSIALPLFAFCFFRIFQNFNMAFHPAINRIASTTFGIYLIHDSGFFRHLIWNTLFCVSDVQFKSGFFILLAIADILAVFAVCCFIDLIRQFFIEERYLKLYSLIEKKLKQICMG